MLPHLNSTNQMIKTSFTHCSSVGWLKFRNSSLERCTRIKIKHTARCTIRLPTDQLDFMIRVRSVGEK